jgi:hypothetical protein
MYENKIRGYLVIKLIRYKWRKQKIMSNCNPMMACKWNESQIWH